MALAEVLNVPVKVSPRQTLGSQLESILSFFDRITLVPSRAYASDADLLSVELDHPIYDCLYAAVAHRETGRLLTADQRFARKGKKRHIDVALILTRV